MVCFFFFFFETVGNTKFLSLKEEYKNFEKSKLYDYSIKTTLSKKIMTTHFTSFCRTMVLKNR